MPEAMMQQAMEHHHHHPIYTSPAVGRILGFRVRPGFLSLNPSSLPRKARIIAYTRTRGGGCQEIISSQLLSPWKTWVHDAEEERIANPSFELPDRVSGSFGSAPLLNGPQILRLAGAAVFLLAAGLLCVPPASASATATATVASPPHPAELAENPEQVDLQNPSDEALPSSQESEKIPEITPEIVSLDENFWKDIDIRSGSIEEVMKKFITTHPDDVKALEALLFNRLENRDTIRAMVVVNRLLQLHPEDLEWKHMKAQIHEARGEVDKAKKELQDILQVEPSSTRALQGMVVLMEQEGQSKEALDLINDALARAIQEEKPSDTRNMKMLLGQFHTLKGNFKEAMELYDALIDEDPKDFRPYLSQGLIYTIMEDTSKANEKFKSFRRLCPKDYAYRSYYEKLLSKFKKEISEVKKELQEEKNNQEVDT